MLNALAVRLFGLRLASFIACGFISLTLGTFLVYRVSCLFLGRIESCGVIAVFRLDSGFQHYTPNNIFNFILPYTFAATYGLLAGLASPSRTWASVIPMVTTRLPSLTRTSCEGYGVRSV